MLFGIMFFVFWSWTIWWKNCENRMKIEKVMSIKAFYYLVSQLSWDATHIDGNGTYGNFCTWLALLSGSVTKCLLVLPYLSCEFLFLSNQKTLHTNTLPKQTEHTERITNFFQDTLLCWINPPITTQLRHYTRENFSTLQHHTLISWTYSPITSQHMHKWTLIIFKIFHHETSP